MAAVLGAFVRYIISFVFLVIVAGLGVFCGKKLHDRDERKKAEQDGEA